MNRMEKLYIVIPAYNEQENIDELIHDWYPIAETIDNSVMLVINDGSKDDTYKKLVDLAKVRPKLDVQSKENGGHGDTLLYGYSYAIEHGADWIFQTDSDGQTKSEEFMTFWNQREKYDAVLGCRRVRGDGKSREQIEKVLCTMLKFFFNVKVPDANCPFRLMRAEKVEKYIKFLPKHYFLPNVMLTVFFAKNDRVKFEDVTFENRKGGTGTINIRKIVGIGLKSVIDFTKFRKEMKIKKNKL